MPKSLADRLVDAAMSWRSKTVAALLAAATLGLAQPATASTWWPVPTGTIDDARGDVPVAAGDIVGFGAAHVGGKITFEAMVASPEDPAGPVWRDSENTLMWAVDLDGPGAEFAVAYFNDGSKVVAQVTTGGRGTPPVCEAEALFLGGRYIARVDADCIGNPTTFGLAVAMTWITPSASSLDFAPDPFTFQPITSRAPRSGYWMVGARAEVYAFGQAPYVGAPSLDLNGTTQRAVDLEPTPSHDAYWILLNDGSVLSRGGDAVPFGSVDAAQLQKGEETTSISATLTGRGYWVFTNRGRVFAFGDAAFLGDMSATRLAGPVLDSIATPTGRGYYMVASDGGIFAFGDALFEGSMGGKRLVAPVQSLVPDPDGGGYWLVASDGGIFAFGADFHGSMGDKRLAKPITGMVAFGNAYLMVAEDGGIFNFSDLEFMGSLGGTPPAMPITSVAVLDEH